MSRAFIDDGYTIDITIPAMDGHHPAAQLSYRPPTFRELRLIDKALSEDASIDESVEASCQYIAAHVVKWDIVGSDGQLVPVSAANCDRLPSALFAAIFNRTRGIYPKGEKAPEPAAETAPGN